MPGYKSITGMTGMGNARELAEMLRQLGRGRDTVLAHITPEEAQMLRDQGGAGTINPDTGLPEFQEDFGESYGNVTEEPQDYSYMNLPSAYGGDVEAQAGGFYGNTPQVNYNPFTDTTYRTVDQGGNVLPGRGQAIAGYFAPGGEFERLQAEQGGLDIGFGPGRFTPERIEPGEIRGATPEQMERFLPTPTVAQRAEGALQNVQDIMSRYPRLTEALGVGAQGIVGAIQAGRARKQGRESAARLTELGRPLREEAENLRRQALAGTLTPQQAREQEIARARARQGATQRGATTGTQAAMIENQLARQRAELSQTNLNNAIRQLNLANAYDEAAIKASLAADREADEILERIYQNIAFSLEASTPPKPPQQPQAQRQRMTLPEAPEVTRRPEIPRSS